MKAMICTAFGGFDEVLTLAERPKPSPGPGQVTIKVQAAGVNFADGLMIGGGYQVKPELPFVPGMELAGTIAEIGAGVSGLVPGQRVMAVVDYGAFAEFALARVEDTVPIPDAMDFAAAAGFPIAYGTSHFGLKDRARLSEGETLLVHGAAGGVGLTAVECGKAMGARVIATAGGPDKVKVALDHGADVGIDYKVEDIRTRVKELTGGKGADVIYDPVGGKVFEASLRAVANEGRILVIGFASGEVPQIPANILLVKNITAIGYYWGAYRRLRPQAVRDSLIELLQWFERGLIKPHVSKNLPLDRAADAIGLLKTRAATGKVVLTV